MSDTLCIYFYQDRYLAFSPDQHPIVLQIGGNDLGNLATAVKLARPYGYDEINFKYAHCPLSLLKVIPFRG